MIRNITFVLFLLSTVLLSGQIKKVTPSNHLIGSAIINSPKANLISANGNTYHYLKPSFSPGYTLQLASSDPRLKVEYSDNENNIWISGTPQSLVHSRTQDLQDQLYSYLKEASPLLRLPAAEDKFKLVSVDKDELGYKHFRMQQYQNGIKVYGSEIIIHGKENLSSLNGKPYAKPISISTSPDLSPGSVVEIMEKDLPEFRKQISDPFHIMDVERFSTELIILPLEEGPRLSYHISGYASMVDRWEYFIDAQTGEILKKFQSICKFHWHKHKSMDYGDGKSQASVPDLFNNIKDINTYEVNSDFYLIDASRSMFDEVNSVMPNEPVGVIWTIDAFNTSPQKDNFFYDHVFSGDNTWSGQETAVSAHFNAGTTYEYFKNTHGRESINAAGNNIISLINIADADGSSMENAFWNGVAMFYGNGGNSFLPLARGLDVAAHEISHGVIQNSANLEYSGESGALNESYADIFGVLVDREDWLIGEDVVKTSTFPSGALRSLSDPHNGAAINDFGKGFQPRKVSEQYTGPEDNGGVHINSGIPNHAFFLFASVVGKSKAEQVYYRALTTYLLKSSQFIDQRLAVIQSALDLYGNGSEAQAAREAFDAVEIYDGDPGNYQEDLETNPGNGFLLLSDNEKSNLYIYDQDLNIIANPLSQRDHISKPSINDDGTVIVFVGSDKRMYYITIDWDAGEFSATTVLQDQPIWRNVVISKDGRRLAALFDDETSRIWIYDFVLDQSNEFELFNPTFTEGVSTGDVKFADAMAFDFSGNYIMYDALNEINSNTSGSIEYWDIGFIKVWDQDSDFWSLGSIEKLFSALPEGISVGNPTFSKNSDYIIAFEVIEEGRADIYGANLQTSELNVLFNNTVLSYPDYNVDDTKIVHDLNLIGTTELGIFDVDNSKIMTIPNSEDFLVEDSRWGVWFANGQRDFSSSAPELQRLELTSVYPNPTEGELTVGFESEETGKVIIEVYAVNGNRVLVRQEQLSSGRNLFTEDVSTLEVGMYLCRVRTENRMGSFLFFKM